jgi:hypothetical protein
MTPSDKRAERVWQGATTAELVGWHGGRTTYTVPSQSEPGEVRIVTLFESGAGRCSCPAGEYRKACVHLASVLLMEHWRAARRQPVGLRAEPCRRLVARKAA